MPQEKTRSAQIAADVIVWIFAAGLSAFIVLGIAWLTKIVFFS